MARTTRVKEGDWRSVKRAIQALSARLDQDQTQTFATITLTDLTATRLVQTDADKKLASVTDLTSWIAGTTDEVTITDDTDGTLTLSLATAITNDILENAKRYGLMLEGWY